jgi:hypothetical protein
MIIYDPYSELLKSVTDNGESLTNFMRKITEMNAESVEKERIRLEQQIAKAQKSSR